ncbi:hypothetical protein LTR56_017523 [Elasticomyces elasticus]|nr:hypothetical protein LTR56_017523 [Elasticomyces elasticus]KAK3665077.1 hypothetical protein LTR22_004133 [Elasticomyces elasticus]KAK4931549.1 hypothetical protein LTR49_001937 [Elasticomyces elasticus]KAK5766709.1 hypothetical protein LTS12_003058 [Elasticomyces elasticus]
MTTVSRQFLRSHHATLLISHRQKTAERVEVVAEALGGDGPVLVTRAVLKRTIAATPENDDDEDDEDKTIDEDLAVEYDPKSEVTILDPETSAVVDNNPISGSIFAAVIKPIASKRDPSKHTTPGTPRIYLSRSC